MKEKSLEKKSFVLYLGGLNMTSGNRSSILAEWTLKTQILAFEILVNIIYYWDFFLYFRSETKIFKEEVAQNPDCCRLIIPK